MKQTQIVFRESIPKEREQTYYERTFPVPEAVCRLDIEYDYRRYEEREGDGGFCRKEINIVDLALRDGHGTYIGASGAGRKHIWISGWDSSDGYVCVDPDAGEWAVIVGTYKIADEGEVIPCEPHTAALNLTRMFSAAKFVRVEVLRQDHRVLLSNPIYFA